MNFELSESQHGQNLRQWLDIMQYNFTHVANESGLPPKVAMLVAKKKKSEGVSKGFPDYVICLKRGRLLFLELKLPMIQLQRNSKRGKKGDFVQNLGSIPSPEQEKWLSVLSEMESVYTTVAYGFDDAVQQVKFFEQKK